MVATVMVEEFSRVGFGNLTQLHNLGLKCLFLTLSLCQQPPSGRDVYLIHLAPPVLMTDFCPGQPCHTGYYLLWEHYASQLPILTVLN